MSREDLQLLLLEAYYRKVTANRPSADIAFRYFVFTFITYGRGTLNAAYAAITAISLIAARQQTQMWLFVALIRIDRLRSPIICRFLRS